MDESSHGELVDAALVYVNDLNETIRNLERLGVRVSVVALPDHCRGEALRDDRIKLTMTFGEPR